MNASITDQVIDHISVNAAPITKLNKLNINQVELKCGCRLKVQKNDDQGLRHFYAVGAQNLRDQCDVAVMNCVLASFCVTNAKLVA